MQGQSLLRPGHPERGGNALFAVQPCSAWGAQMPMKE